MIEHDKIVPFPTPPTRLLRVLLEEAHATRKAAVVALRMISHVERTADGQPCPWCRLQKVHRLDK